MISGTELFEGSRWMLIYADKIEEMKTICWFCERKAIMNLRVIDGKPVYAGEQILIGGNDTSLFAANVIPIPLYHRTFTNNPPFKT